MLPTLTEVARRLKPATDDHDLPRLVLMTDVARLPHPESAVARLPAGSAVIVRHPDPARRRALAEHLSGPCRLADIRLLVAADPDLAVAIGADGLHLPETMVRAGIRFRRPQKARWLLTAAAHSPRAIRLAAARGVDAVLLSPVFPTLSHPGAPAIGPVRFSAWTRAAPLSVYALGGITAGTARRLIDSGACGFAGIEGFLSAS